MKHSPKALIFIVSFFALTQVMGLFLIGLDIETVHTIIDSTGEEITIVEHSEATEEIRPQLAGGQSFVFLLIGILLGTVILLILLKFQKHNIWKYWFTFAVFLAISIALMVILPVWIAYLIAIIFALFKTHYPHVLFHNITEILMYSGIAVLVVPIFNIFWVIMLLLAISAYDMYAVWKSKHMIHMAKFMSESSFAGLILPYHSEKGHKLMSKMSKKRLGSAPLSKEKVAILGGGDVAFPLIFSGVVMEWFVMKGYTLQYSFGFGLICSIFAGLALTLLLIYGKHDKFYPAMPFITTGSLVGLLIVAGLSLL